MFCLKKDVDSAIATVLQRYPITVSSYFVVLQKMLSCKKPDSENIEQSSAKMLVDVVKNLFPCLEFVHCPVFTSLVGSFHFNSSIPVYLFNSFCIALRVFTSH